MVELDDDGTTVTLDLHGLTVDEALSVSMQTLSLAEKRGRSTLKIIHGYSTTGTPGRQTIKKALYNALDRGFLQEYTDTHHRQKGALIVSLGVGGASRKQPIRTADIWPP